MRKDYKYYSHGFCMENKRGQLAIFVIIAIVIVALFLLLFFFRGKGPISPGTSVFSPQSYLQSCFGDELKKNVEMLSKQGGYENPEGYLDYDNAKIKYLCYTSENYKTCTIQQPLIKEHFESELNAKASSRIKQCVQNLKGEYEKRGYEVSLGNIDASVSFVPEKLLVAITAPITIKKADESRSFNGFDINIMSEMYSLLMTAVSIIDYEATYGDSETTLYMQYYPYLKIEKTRLSEGSKIYRLTNIVTSESFTFASRSLVWPPGYGFS